MSTILQKHQMGEEDIKLQYITPAILSKWSREKITMETRITDGKINLKGNFVFREKPKRADYILYLSANNPIAIVEAKDNTHAVSHGLQQAMTYAQMLDIPFAYSSNGDGFMEHDFLTGQEREIGLDEFPSERPDRKPSWNSPIIPARIPILRAITSVSPLTGRWMPLRADSSGFFLLWPQAPVRPILPSRLCTDCCKAA